MEFVIEPQQHKVLQIVSVTQENNTAECAHWKLKFAYAEATGPDDGPEAMQRA